MVTVPDDRSRHLEARLLQVQRDVPLPTTRSRQVRPKYGKFCPLTYSFCLGQAKPGEGEAM